MGSGSPLQQERGRPEADVGSSEVGAVLVEKPRQRIRQLKRRKGRRLICGHILVLLGQILKHLHVTDACLRRPASKRWADGAIRALLQLSVRERMSPRHPYAAYSCSAHKLATALQAILLFVGLVTQASSAGPRKVARG